MKMTRRLTLLALTAAATLTTQVVATAQSTNVRVFHNRGFDYGYEGWSDLASIQTKNPDSVCIKGSAKGGVGIVFPQVLDILDAGQLEVRIKPGPENTENKLFLKLIPASGKDSIMADLNLLNLSTTEFTTLTVALPAKGTPAGDKLEEIKQLQIQGSFNPSFKVDIEIESIKATAGTPAAEAGKGGAPVKK